MRDNTKLRAFVLPDEAAILAYRETRKSPKGERWIDVSNEKSCCICSEGIVLSIRPVEAYRILA